MGGVNMEVGGVKSQLRLLRKDPDIRDEPSNDELQSERYMRAYPTSICTQNTRAVAEPHGTGAQQPTQRPQTRQDGGSGRTSSGNAWSRGAPSFASNSNYTGQAFRRRNVVRFRHGGAKEDLPDRRFVVRELLCTQMGFVPTDILAVINLPDRQGYDVSFKLMSDLDRFWANLTRLRDTEGWDKFSFIPISRPDTASVTIVFWNEAVPPQDIVIWLRRHCDLMSDLSKNRDEDGVWTGGWRVLVKLRQQNNITQHLPNSFFIGREKGICFYAGQPRRCFKCGKAGHVASVCSMVKCSLCNEMGHVSATCQNIRCNLCGRIGHPHRDCPDAWHNICKDSPDEDLLAAADDIQEEEEALLSGSVVTEAEPQPHTGDTTQDQAESGPIETTMEVVEQVVQPSVVVSSPARSSNNNKRRKKDKASRKPEGEWTTVEKPTKMRVSSAGEVTATGNRFSVLSESDGEAELDRELSRMMAEYEEEPEGDPPTKRRPHRDEGQSESDMETAGHQDTSDSDL
ncbi:uncharacterized protein RB166_016173 [Leptodactylus fuscus]